MRKIVAGFAASLDGFIEGPDGEYDWILIDKEMNFAEQMKRYDTFLFGRISYEKVLPAVGKAIPGVTNYVISTTLKKVHPNYKLITGDIMEQINEIKQQPGKDIALFGGANLLTSLLDLQLVDEISVAIIPVLLGQGKPMVQVLKEKSWLSLIRSRTYSNGTILVDYEVKR